MHTEEQMKFWESLNKWILAVIITPSIILQVLSWNYPVLPGFLLSPIFSGTEVRRRQLYTHTLSNQPLGGSSWCLRSSTRRLQIYKIHLTSIINKLESILQGNSSVIERESTSDICKRGWEHYYRLSYNFWLGFCYWSCSWSERWYRTKCYLLEELCSKVRPPHTVPSL